MADLNWNSHNLTHGWQKGVTAFYYGLGFDDADVDKAVDEVQRAVDAIPDIPAEVERLTVRTPRWVRRLRGCAPHPY